MYTRTLTVSELFNTLNTKSENEELTVLDFLTNGLRTNNDGMAIAAMEELCKRGESDLITCALAEAFDAGYIKVGTTFSITLANCLAKIGRDIDPILRRYGKTLRNEHVSIREYYEKEGKAWDDTLRKELPKELTYLSGDNKEPVDDLESVLGTVGKVAKMNASIEEKFGNSKA